MFFDVRQHCTELLTAACCVRGVTSIAAVCWLECEKEGGKVEELKKFGRWNHSSEGGSWLLAPKTDPFPSLSPGCILNSHIFQKWWGLHTSRKIQRESFPHWEIALQKPCRPSGILSVQHPMRILLPPWRMPWIQILAWWLFSSRKRGQRKAGWSGEIGGHIIKCWVYQPGARHAEPVWGSVRSDLGPMPLLSVCLAYKIQFHKRYSWMSLLQSKSIILGNRIITQFVIISIYFARVAFVFDQFLSHVVYF